MPKLEEEDLPDLPPDAFIDGSTRELDDTWLKKADRPLQIAALVGWFQARYWDPVMETPYISSEGGYFWVNGGPYEAEDQLSARFDGIVSAEVIEAAKEIVEGDGVYEWAPSPLTYYDEEQDVSVDNRKVPTKRLQERLDELMGVLALRGEESATRTVKKLVFAGVVAALETFLWETMVYWLENDENTVRNIVTKVPALMLRNLKLGQIFEVQANLKTEVRSYLQSLVWHQFDKVAPLMRYGLGIKLPSFRPFRDGILRRHDIVHRSGHDIAGNAITVSDEDIRELAKLVLAFANEIDLKIAASKREF